RGADERHARARVPGRADGLHVAASGVFTGKRGGGYSPLVRVAALALACAVVGAAAALGIGRAAGLVGGSSTKTVGVREARHPRPTRAVVRRPAVPAVSSGFAPARIFASRSPGVVTVFSYFGGTAAQGSGFVVSRTGTILTNAHVITNAGETSGPVR